MAASRRQVPPDEAWRAAKQAAAHLALAVELQVCRSVVAYASLPGELPSGPLVALAQARGIPLLWPRIVGEGLEFARARPEDLVVGRYAVPAPPGEVPAEGLGPGALLLVPGLAFDARGGRLGRGRGYYDRALALARGVTAIGVGYELQRLEQVPMGSHDQRVQAVLTERGLYRIPPGESEE